MKIFLDGIIFSLQQEGGISRTYREILPRIAALDTVADFTLYCRRKLQGDRMPVSPQIHPLFERSVYPWRWFIGKTATQIKLLQRAYEHSCPDIFHSTYCTYLSRVRTPCIATVYDMTYERCADMFQQPHHLQLVQDKRRSVEQATLVVTNSHSTARDVQEYFGVDIRRIAVVYLGVGDPFRCIGDPRLVETFRTKHGLEKPTILYVGRRRFYKNFLRLLEGFISSKLAKDYDLVAVGGEPAWTPDEEGLIAQHGVQRAVRLLPTLSENDLVLAYNSAKVFVYPSLYEGFGLPLLEAMACGTPVIASNRASMPEVAGEAALFFDPESPDSIASALRGALESTMAGALRGKGLQRVAQFSWDNTARQMTAVYRQVL